MRRIYFSRRKKQVEAYPQISISTEILNKNDVSPQQWCEKITYSEATERSCVDHRATHAWDIAQQCLFSSEHIL